MRKGPNAPPVAKTTAEYLRRLTPAKRATLEKVRAAIKAAVPKADECISYGIPAFCLDGRIVAYYHAATNHCSFFPGAYPVAKYKDELAGYETSKGTVRFPVGKPLPATLVKKLVKARIEENAELQRLRDAKRSATRASAPSAARAARRPTS